MHNIVLTITVIIAVQYPSISRNKKIILKMEGLNCYGNKTRSFKSRQGGKECIDGFYDLCSYCNCFLPSL